MDKPPIFSKKRKGKEKQKSWMEDLLSVQMQIYVCLVSSFTKAIPIYYTLEINEIFVYM